MCVKAPTPEHPTFWREVRRTARDVRAAFTEMPDEPFRGAKSIFPQVWCEWASIALAEVLAARGLGEWSFVENKLPDSLSGHAWIELRDRHGSLLFAIDITLDQFAEWDRLVRRRRSDACPREVQSLELRRTLARLAGDRKESDLRGLRGEVGPVSRFVGPMMRAEGGWRTE